MNQDRYDFVVIGAGLAGCAAAWWLSHLGEVALLSKVPPEGSNSHHAQGGLAAAVGAGDSPAWHAEDTLAAGAGLCRPDAVARLTARAPQLVRWLVDLGVPFDRAADGSLRLGLEGAHGRPRILHAGGDASGRHILAAVRQALTLRPTVDVLWDAQVVRLARHPSRERPGRVTGVWVARPGGLWFVGARRGVVLATGGAGQLFAATTNPPGATGEGLVLAYDAGATLRNLEFMQFHPTALASEGNPRFLLSEALRGAGATLIDERGAPVMADHPQGDLAPRDVVARAVYARLQRGERVYLDATRIGDLAERFPTVYEGCRSHGFDLVAEPVPVTPAAHFLMGGVAATLAGETDVPGLYAVGEVANTGCHGANRLASNSLLECLVMAYELYEHVRSGEDADVPAAPAAAASPAGADAADALGGGIERVQQILWTHVGLVRHATGLRKAIGVLAALEEVHPGSAAVRAARLMAESALVRQESRGAHYRSDFPHPAADLAGCDTLCRVGQPPRLQAAEVVPAGAAWVRM
ncbi:L-aspartate oxidase [Alicyclobacillus macrosporangiidus]|uniref:L-aspartate oxidase n=1 Tax=Alicyclobacillus macrosporangiidus TaxID=392015 RepID=UPI0009DF4263|nr:L-aspartate oxidase [Alicyclobacillus macrosporangiidus]